MVDVASVEDVQFGSGEIPAGKSRRADEYLGRFCGDDF